VAPVKELVAAGRNQDAFWTWARTLNLMDTYTNNIDHYNFLVFSKPNHAADKRTLLETGKYS